MNEDSIALLKECNAGCKSATNSMEQILDFIESKDARLKELVSDYNKKHIDLGDKCHELLNNENEDEKDPHPMAKAFSWLSTETKLSFNNDAHQVASILIDGCNMGMKSIHEYVNKYTEAQSPSVDIAMNLISLEKEFMDKLGEWL